MTILSFPEDSVLSRHFETTVELKRQLWLQTPPSDSVLRRHAQGHGGHQTSSAAEQAGSRRARTPKPNSATAPPTHAHRSPRDNRGFFARLLGYLTGRG